VIHAPTDRRERIVFFADRGDGKSSTYINIAEWMERTRSTRKIYLLDSDYGWAANRAQDGSLDRFFEVRTVDRERFGGADGWTSQVKSFSRFVHPDDWAVVDLQTHAWDGAQRWYWGQKTGNDSLAELWLKNRPEEVSGDHGTNWGIINKFYGEFTSSIIRLPCHILFLASATEVRKTDSLKTRSFYTGLEMRMEGQKDLRGEGHTVLFGFEANGRYRYTTVKERGPTRDKRVYLENEDVTDGGFVPGYLFKVAGWRP
jgi:hypothetical protein